MAGAAVGLGVVAAVATPADATYGHSTGSRAAVTMTTLDATKGTCSSGKAAWDVRTRVVVTNKTSNTITVKDIGYVAAYSVGEDDGYTAVVQANQDGGLRAGTTIAGNATRTFTTAVRYSLPCAADNAASLLGFRLTGECADGASDCPFYGAYAQFISNGSAMPSGALGIVGFSGLALTGLGVTVWQGNRRKASQ